jgi:hypothetical protein
MLDIHTRSLLKEISIYKCPVNLYTSTDLDTKFIGSMHKDYTFDKT